jgi:hypothetical protein
MITLWNRITARFRRNKHEFCPKANDADKDGVYASTVHPPLTHKQTIDTLRAAIVELEKQIKRLEKK